MQNRGTAAGREGWILCPGRAAKDRGCATSPPEKIGRKIIQNRGIAAGREGWILRPGRAAVGCGCATSPPEVRMKRNEVRLHAKPVDCDGCME